MVGATFSTLSSGAIVRMQKTRCFYSWKRKHSGCQWRIEVIAGASGPAISSLCSTGSTNRTDMANVANILKLQCLTDISILTLISHASWMYWPGIGSNDNPFLACNRPFQHFHWLLPVSVSMTPVHPKASAPKGKLEIVKICMGEPKQTLDFLRSLLPKIVNTVKNVSCTGCQPHGYFRILFGLFS